MHLELRGNKLITDIVGLGGSLNLIIEEEGVQGNSGLCPREFMG